MLGQGWLPLKPHPCLHPVQALFLENVMHGMCTSYVSPALPTMNVGLSVSDRRQALLGGETGTAVSAWLVDWAAAAAGTRSPAACRSARCWVAGLS